MKLHFMKDDALVYFKNNVDSNLEYYLNQDNSWIYEKYSAYKGDDVSPFGEFKLEVPDFQMDMSEESPSRSDYNNCKILYTALKDISDTQATDERFWVGLAHSQLWEYMLYRCKLNDDTNKENKIVANYFYNYGNKRSLLVHTLARLWWVGRLTYDKSSKEPFAALSYLKIDFPTKVLTLFSSNFTNNPIITRAILLATSSLDKSGYKIGRKEYFELIRYVNFLGGIIILDYLTEDELKQKIINHYFEINNITLQDKCLDASNESEELIELSQNSYEHLYYPQGLLNLLREDNAIYINLRNLNFCNQNFGISMPILKEYNSNLSLERLTRYGNRKNIYDETVHEIGNLKFLLLNNSLLKGNELINTYIQQKMLLTV